MARRTWSAADIRALGVTTDVATAGEILGIGRTKSHELARDDQFPVRVLRIGVRRIVPVAGLLAALGLDTPNVVPAADRTGSLPGIERSYPSTEPTD